MPELDQTKRYLPWTVYTTPRMTLTTDLGLSILRRVSMFEHVGWWLRPLSMSPGMGEGGDWWSWLKGVIMKGIPRVCQGVVTSVFLVYPLSYFKKNSESILKHTIFSLTNYQNVPTPAHKILDCFHPVETSLPVCYCNIGPKVQN